jgi:hypothetical protein
VRAGTLLYSDETHLTNAGALLLYPRLITFLGRLAEAEPPRQARDQLPAS